MSEPVYIIRKSSTGATFHYDGEISWLNKSHELMTGEFVFAFDGPIRDAINEGGKPEAYIPLDLLRRCIEAFKPVNAASLDQGGLRKGCVTLYETDATSVSLWQCPPSCPICEAVRVLGMTNEP